MPGIDEDRHAAIAVDSVGISPVVEVEPNDCRFGRVVWDHPDAPGGGTAVSTEVGVVVDRNSKITRWLF